MTDQSTPVYRALFEPYQIKHLSLKNRIISTPHGPAYPRTACRPNVISVITRRKPKAGLP